MTTLDIDDFPYNRRQAIVAKALRERQPITERPLYDIMGDARAVLLALGEVEGAPPTGEESVLVDGKEEYGLNAAQVIRLECAKLVFSDGLDLAPEDRIRDVLRLAAAIETGSTGDDRDTPERRDERAKWLTDIAKILRATTNVPDPKAFLVVADFLDPPEVPHAESAEPTPPQNVDGAAPKQPQPTA